MELSSKMAYSGDNTMVLSNFFDDCNILLIFIIKIDQSPSPRIRF